MYNLIIRALVCVACLSGCAKEAPPAPAAPPKPLPATRTFDMRRDTVALHYLDAERGIISARGVDDVPERWRGLVLVDFADDVDERDKYYVAELWEQRGEATAQLMTGSALNERANLLAIAQEDADDVTAIAFDHLTEALKRKTRDAAPAAPKPRRPAKRSEPTGLVVEVNEGARYEAPALRPPPRGDEKYVHTRPRRTTARYQYVPTDANGCPAGERCDE